MEINWLAVLVSAIVAMVIGTLWYGPLFGKQWMRLTGQTPESMAAAKAKGMTASYVINFVGALVMSGVFAWLIGAVGNPSVGAGLIGGFWLWLGFIAPVMLGKVLWEGKSWALYILDVAYYLVLLLVIGAILGGWT